MVNTKAQKKARIASASSVELALRSVGDEVKNAIRKEPEEGAKAFFSQILNLGGASSESPESNEKKQGPLVLKDPETGEIEIFNAASLRADERAEKVAEARKQKKETGSYREAAINHGSEVRRSGEKHLNQEKQSTTQKVEQLRNELKQQVKPSGSEAAKSAANVLGDTPRNAGIYHEGFFRGLIQAYKASKVSGESGEWLKVGKTRNGKKGSLANISRGGKDTNKTLSNERQVATNVG